MLHLGRRRTTKERGHLRGTSAKYRLTIIISNLCNRNIIINLVCQFLQCFFDFSQCWYTTCKLVAQKNVLINQCSK